ncbi:MAG: bifunctional uroporphyrinogen-III C-methyltransferase/uroporphyrinogen-III synthase [Frankiales bacterium]|jgi:uroporphyrinogen III methyltransferase/synthase|nr:bifunctional uroporphyrinogen-III C-methyltransferase/uroporphyrinogen-III synthase [Frankiales bacterium]
MSPTRAKKPAGQVALVGAGAGDPGLLALRAAELLGRAELVLVDERVDEALLVHVAQDAEVVRTPSAEAQGPALVAAAKDGRLVVRLLPGDPYSCDHGPKEAEALLKAKQRLEVVPGVPATVAVPGYAGLVLGSPRTVARLDETVDWRALAGAPGALVLETVASEVGKAASALVEHGRKAETPASVTAGGTGAEQRTVLTTLDSADADVSAAGLSGDVVVVVGDPVKKIAKFGWYESRPLYGWRVLVPRTRDQAGVLSQALRGYGAIPVEVPTIAVEPPRTPAPMERAVKGLVTGRYLWVAFTSTNAVKAVREKLEEFGLDARAFAGVKVAAVGETTAQALVEFGIKPDLVPSGQQSSEGLLADWAPYDEVFDPMDRVLLPRADIATDTLLAGLKELGWQVDDVTAYRTVRAAPPPAETREALKGGGFDAVLFTSSSTVRNLVGIAGKPHDTTVLACIGPQTAATAEELGLRVDVLSPRPDVATLVAALAEHAAGREGELPSAARRRKLAKAARR